MSPSNDTIKEKKGLPMKPGKSKMQYDPDHQGYIGVTSEGKRVFVDQDAWAEHEQADPPVPPEMLLDPDLWTSCVGDERIYYLDDDTSTFEQTLESFLEDKEAFAQALLTAGALRDHGGYYNIELLPDGYNLWNENYYGPITGILIGLPAISDEHYVLLLQAAESSDNDELVKELCGESDWILDQVESSLRIALEEAQKGTEDV